MKSQALYRRLRPGPHGAERDHEQVLRHQRTRLCGAMVEAVAERGYPPVSVQQLVTLAGVSKRSFYEHFPCKEACFLATFDTIALEAVERLAAAAGAAEHLTIARDRSEHLAIARDRSEHLAIAHRQRPVESGERLRMLLESALSAVARHQREARLCMVEAHAAGAAAGECVERARREAERALMSCLSQQPDELAPPPLPVKAVTHGIWHLAYSRLLRGRAEELPQLAHELWEWTLSYRCPPHALADAPPLTKARVAAPLPDPPAGDERRRLQRMALEIVGRRGWLALTRASLLDLAHVEERAFAALYDDVDQCFLEGLDLLAVEALARMLSAGRAAAPERLTAREWPTVVQCAIDALLDLFAREPALVRVACAEALSAGPAALERLEHLLNAFAGLLRRSVPPDCRRPSPAVSQAIVGAIWGVLHDYVTADAIGRLRELTAHLSFVVLAPAIGAQAAAESVQDAAPGSQQRSLVCSA